MSPSHSCTRPLFVCINALFGLTLSGIDYMVTDLSQPYDVNNHHAIEVNDGYAVPAQAS